MTYQPLHHKYRPQTFTDLVGQEAIATTLTNAIRTERIAPAYLFTGSRGTGKTSSARILAKSLNCLSGDKPTDRPCGSCAVCKGIANGSVLDVIEIDAASNTGVDNIRELIERAQFAPVQCRYKVYVIDECHMLSGAAFNALLKTLEEPPERVVFVLATTDPQRVLPTIISRCQRFDFRRIPLPAMVKHLRLIADKENININDEAITLVAQFSQGGLRDAESLLDQLSLLTEQVTVERVWDLVGAVPERDLLALLEAIANSNAEAVIQKARDLMDRGREPLIVLQNLAGFYRDLLIAKTAPSRSDLVAITATTWAQLCEVAQRFDNNKILLGQKHLKDSEVQIKNTSQPRLWLEVTLLGLLSLSVPSNQQQPIVISDYSESKNGDNKQQQNAKIKPELSTQQLKWDESPVQKTSNFTSITQSDVSISESSKNLTSQETPEIPTAEPAKLVTSNAQVETNSAPAYDLKQVWQQVIEYLSPPATQALLKQHCCLVNYNGQTAIVGISSQPLLKLASGKLSNIEEAFIKAFNKKIKVSMQVGMQNESSSAIAQKTTIAAPIINESSLETTDAIASASRSPSPISLPSNETTSNGSPTVIKKPEIQPVPKAKLLDEVEIAAQKVAEFFQGEIIKISEPTNFIYKQAEETTEVLIEEEEEEDYDF